MCWTASGGSRAARARAGSDLLISVSNKTGEFLCHRRRLTTERSGQRHRLSSLDTFKSAPVRSPIIGSSDEFHSGKLTAGIFATGFPMWKRRSRNEQPENVVLLQREVAQ